MANKKIYTIPIDSTKFKVAIHELGWSIRRLGNDPYINRTEKTIRRQINNGEISPYLLSRIAKVMNVSEAMLYETIKIL